MPGQLKKSIILRKLAGFLLLFSVLLASVLIFTGAAFRNVNAARHHKISLYEARQTADFAGEAVFEKMAASLDAIQQAAMRLTIIVLIFIPAMLYLMIRTLSRGIRLYRENKSDETRQLMFDSAPVVMTIFDRDLNILDCNEEALRRYGLKSKAQYASNFFGTSPKFQPDGKLSVKKGKEMMQKCFAQGYVQFEWMHKSIDGEPLPSEIICLRIKHNDEDVMLAYAIDLRELKKSEKQRQEAAERVQLMFEHAPLLIEYWDENFQCIDSNNKAVDFYGLASKEDYISRWLDFFPDTQRDGVSSKEYWENYLRKVLDKGAAGCNFTGIRGSGEPIFYDVTGFRMKLNGKNVVITYSNDISELNKSMERAQRVEAAEENSRMKSRFLARMSHEIRTPIAAVLGISEIQLRSKSLSLELEEAFAKIHSSADTLLAIVNDILDLSKIEAGKMTIVNDEYNTAGMLGDIVQLNLAFLGSKKIDFIVDVDEKLPCRMTGDELRIKQILNNLLSNAFKYTQTGFVKLKAEAQKSGQEDNVDLLICISDSGQGMTGEQLDALFNEYSRFHEKEIKFSQGTGLGMPITYSLLQLMGGSIDVQSKTGEGTTVTLKIPQKAADSAVLGRETAKSLKEFKTDSKSMAKKLNFVPEPMPYGKVLVVDDVDTNLYVAKGLLSMYKIQVETCESGFEAIDNIKSGNVYDIVFMDHTMPELDGIETTQILRDMGYKLPIVALTANALIGQAEEFLKNGFDGFISKPIQTTHLDAILIKFIKDKFAGFDGFDDFDDSHNSNEFLSSPDMTDRIRRDFLDGQKNVFAEITQAITKGDIKTAYRLTHNLKNMAALINDNALVQAALSVETSLNQAGADGSLANGLTQSQMDMLEKELTRAVEHISKLV